MSTFDYMNVVSGYIINKLENKKDMEESIEINIKPVKDIDTNDLTYEVREIKDFKEQVFYLKFKCESKEEFYSAVKSLLIEYFKNSDDLIAYYATSKPLAENSKFSIVTKSRAQVSFDLEDEQDKMVFESFKNYLNGKTQVAKTQENNVLEEELDEVKSLKKIRL